MEDDPAFYSPNPNDLLIVQVGLNIVAHGGVKNTPKREVILLLQKQHHKYIIEESASPATAAGQRDPFNDPSKSLICNDL